MKKTLIIGASTNRARYSYQATEKLLEHKHEVVLIGRREGVVLERKIYTEKIPLNGIHTVTLYIAPQHQEEYYEYILSLHPKRVIFNPGTENPEFEAMLQKNNIEADEACTLVLLYTNQY